MNEKTTATHKKRILVVDDNEDLSVMLDQLLEGAGYQAMLAVWANNLEAYAFRHPEQPPNNKIH